MENQVVVQLPVSEATDFDSLVQIENGLIEILAKHRGARVDGHEIGRGRFNVFIVSDEPWPSVFGRIQAFLEFQEVLEDAVIATRAAEGEEYQVLWPSDHGRAFEL
jgi:hypothetical protein